MVSSSGLSAAYGGFQQGRLTDQKIDSGDITNQNALIDQQGTEALGRAIQAFHASVPGAQPMGAAPPTGMPPQGAAPQPPMPGQPSMPRPSMEQGPMPGGQAPMGSQSTPPSPAAMQAPQAPQPAAMQGMPGGGTGGIDALRGKLDLQTLMGAIAKANPGAKPAVIASAVTKALPLLNAQAQMDWKQMSLALGAGRLDNAREATAIRGEEAERKQVQGDVRLNQGAQRIEQQAGELTSRDTRRTAQTDQGAQRIDLAGQREARLAVQGQVRQDQRWQQLEQQKAALEQRVTQAGDRAALSEWRAIVDAQHKRAMEIIGSSSINSGLTPADKKALIDEQNQFYKQQIEQMRKGPARPERSAGADTSGGAEPSKTADRPPASGPPIKVTTPQEAEALEPGTRYATPDGQVFTR